MEFYLLTPGSAMPASPAPLRNALDFRPEPGVPLEVAPGIARVVAPNPGPFTFTGTNSFLVGEDEVAIVDPGPDRAEHLFALLHAIAGRRVIAILLTHTHTDHSRLARRLQRKTGAPVCFAGRHRLSRPARPFERNAVALHSDFGLVPDETVGDGWELTAGGVRMVAVTTPGHCANHCCFGVLESRLLLSGDHVMGWSSTLISVPDGDMADYLASLEKLMALPYRHYLPAHGDSIPNGPARARALLAHRRHRNEEVVAAVAAGARSVAAVVRALYTDLEPGVVPAARMTVRAHVEYLAGRGQLRLRRGLFGLRLQPA